MKWADPKKNRVLLFSPHADDELFGAGGTLMRLSEGGAEIMCVLICCSDMKMRHTGSVTGEEREKEFLKSCTSIGVDSAFVLHYNDSALDCIEIRTLIKDIEEIIIDFKPTIVFIPEPSYHQDHQVVNRAAVAALRPAGNWQPNTILSYEVPTSYWGGGNTVFTPNVYCNIDKYIDRKVSILRDIYVSQYTMKSRQMLGEEGLIRHSKYRGLEAGCINAEGFVLLRNVF